jgi:hypothetical protein
MVETCPRCSSSRPDIYTEVARASTIAKRHPHQIHSNSINSQLFLTQTYRPCYIHQAKMKPAAILLALTTTIASAMVVHDVRSDAKSPTLEARNAYQLGVNLLPTQAVPATSRPFVTTTSLLAMRQVSVAPKATNGSLGRSKKTGPRRVKAASVFSQTLLVA